MRDALSLVEQRLGESRAAAIDRLSGDAAPAPGREACVDLVLLQRLLRSFLEAVGPGDGHDEVLHFVGLPPELVGPAAEARWLGTAGDGPDSALLDEALATAPWIRQGAFALERLLRALSADGQRKALGKFYTPPHVVEHVLERTLEPLLFRRGPEELRVLEPACGAGDFALPVFDRLCEAWREAGLDPAEACRRALESNLFAVDRDPVAVAVTRTRLVVRCLDAVRDDPGLPRHHVLQENALWDALEPPPLGDDTLPLPLPPPPAPPPVLDRGGGLIAGHAPFDVVVGNPPYGARLETAEKDWLRRRYSLSHGRMDTAALFLERSLELLAPHGSLGLVMPHSFCRSGGYAAARRLLLEQLKLQSLFDLGDDFPGVSFNTMVFTGTRGRARRQVELHRAEGGRIVRTSRVPRSFYAGRDTLPMHVAAEDVDFYLGMEQAGRPLRSLVHNERGVNLPRRRSRLGDERGEGRVPVVQGRDLEPFALIELDRLPTVAEGPDVQPLGPDPSIGLQNISNVIEATLLPAGVLPLDTVNVLWIEDEAVGPEYLLGVLNSEVIAAYFLDVVISRATLTVHLDGPVLGGIPIVVATPGDQERVAAPVRALLGLGCEPAASEDRSRLRAEVDLEVSRIYGVDRARASRLERRFREGRS